jgi:hypothetical protein
LKALPRILSEQKVGWPWPLLICGLILLIATRVFAVPADSWALASPDGKCSICVALGEDGALRYHAAYDGKTVVTDSPMGLRCDDQSFERSLRFDRAGRVERHHEKYELFSGAQRQVNHIVNHRTLAFHNTNNVKLEIELAASDEGVAFRYRFPQRSQHVRIVESELSGFTIPAGADGWMQPYHAAGPYTPAYEDFFFHVSPGDPPPDSRAKARGWAFPALFHVPDAGAWLLLTESGTDASYCACHLSSNCVGGVYRIAFPVADETSEGYTNKFSPEPRYTLPWTMPWRVIIVNSSAGAIAMESLVTDLAAPSRIARTSWIHPGRASWAWWSYPEEKPTTNRFNEFSDFAAKMGWEYTLFDAGWWKVGIKSIAKHALAEGVMPLAWYRAGDFYDASGRARRLDKMAKAGVRGVKVDFWCSDRQEAIAAQQALMQDAADRKMLVNLHGCTIPRGWQRTWPNFLTCEAVLGSESYFYESRYTEMAAELDTVLPFTRNAVGPMDVTPVACSPKKYANTTTAAFQLATAIIFTSGIIHYADKPEFFETLPPEVLNIFREAPARWDESRCLVGEPGKAVVFARRSGQTWFIAGINGTSESMPMDLDLSVFAAFPNRLLVTEGTEPAMQVTAARIGAESKWQYTLPPRSGFILRLTK